eukprot:7478711-Lingulodinium_polyedra.AAC.1
MKTWLMWRWSGRSRGCCKPWRRNRPLASARTRNAARTGCRGVRNGGAERPPDIQCRVIARHGHSVVAHARV